MKRQSRLISVILVAICAQALGHRAIAKTRHRFGLWPTRGNGPLELVLHDVQVNIDHPLVETIVTQEFENPTPFQREAYYYYPVPAGATVTSLALWVNGKRRQARMLERQKAREIYQGIVDQKRDPALVERIDGNLFRVRIFPILPRRRHRVELRFVQPIGQDAPGRYRFTLAKPPGPRIDVLHLGVTVEGNLPLAQPELRGYSGTWTATSRGFALARGASDQSFSRAIELIYRRRRLVSTPIAVSSLLSGSQAKRAFVAEIPRRRMREASPRRVVLLVDRSRSMKQRRGWADRVTRRVAATLGPRDRLAVVPFDLLPFDSALRLRRADATGSKASLEALSWPSRSLGSAFLPAFEAAMAVKPTHIVCITDGGDRYHQRELQQLLRQRFDAAHTPHISALLPSNSTNQQPFTDLARLTGGHVLRGGDALGAARLLDGAPKASATLDGQRLLVLRDDPHRLLVAGVVDDAEEARAMRLQVAGEKQIRILRIGGGDVHAAEGLWALAAIDRLMTRIKLFGEERPLVDRIIALSKRHHVASEYTALLVTETDADYLRPTSGRRWQRKLSDIGDSPPAPSFQSTPEPHEVLMVGLLLLMIYLAKRRRLGHARRGAR